MALTPEQALIPCLPGDRNTTQPQSLPPAQEILDHILPACPGLQPPIRFVLQARGKRLRSRLLFLCARLFDRPLPHLTEAGILVELLHNGTLLHDDVMDRAATRRGRPTVNRLWGDPVAILAGDFLLAAVMDLALRIQVPSIPALAVETLVQLVDGQVTEILHHGDLSVTEPRLVEIARNKTGSLFSMACRLAGILAGAGTYRTRALASFGLNLGQAFQIIDDVNDYLGDPGATGKEPGRDLAEAKVTLPVLAAYRRAGTAEQGRIRQIFADPGLRARRLKELTLLVDRLGGFSYCLRKAAGWIERAVEALQAFPESRARDELDRTARAILPDRMPGASPGTRALAQVS